MLVLIFFHPSAGLLVVVDDMVVVGTDPILKGMGKLQSESECTRDRRDENR